MEEMYASVHICTCAEKMTFLGKDDKNIVKWGRVITGLRATLPNHIPACRSEFKLSIMKSFWIVKTVMEALVVCQSQIGNFSHIFRFFYDGSPTRQTVKNNWRTSWSWAVPSSALAGVDLVYFGSAAKLDTSWWLAGTSWVAKELENNN